MKIKPVVHRAGLKPASLVSGRISSDYSVWILLRAGNSSQHQELHYVVYKHIISTPFIFFILEYNSSHSTLISVGDSPT